MLEFLCNIFKRALYATARVLNLPPACEPLATAGACRRLRPILKSDAETQPQSQPASYPP
jgi:hypothetical protein